MRFQSHYCKYKLKNKMTKKQISSYQQFIAKPEISFWTPIIFTAVTITISFMTLTNQVALQNQKLDTLIANQDNIIDKYEEVQVRLGTDEREISILKTNQTMVLTKLGIQ